METRGKAMEFVGDRISGLPDELLHHAMSLLPARDAVRTSVLSPRWRNLWATARCLNIEAKGFTRQRKFIKFMTGLLISRGCTPLESFCINANGPAGIFLFNFPDTVYLWISHALRSNVQELRIMEHDPVPDPNPDDAIDDDLRPVTFLLDHSLFHSLYLKRLHLQYVRINDNCFTKRLFSSRPALEDLDMMDCAIYATEFSSASLKNFNIDYDSFPVCDEAYYEASRALVITMPNLTSLRIGHLVRRTEVPTLVNMKSLVTASISLSGDEQFVTSADGCNLLAALSHVKNLELLLPDEVHDEYVLQSNVLLRQVEFTNLVAVHLTGWCFRGDCKALLYLLGHSPILKKLTLKLEGVGDDWSPSSATEMKPTSTQSTTPFPCEKFKKFRSSAELVI